MNIEKLFELQGDFFARHPDGFEDEELVKIRKKHNIDKLSAQTQGFFSESQFGKVESIIQNMILVMSRSSMVSMFDKPKFRDGIGTLSPAEREHLADAMFDLLHGDTEKGFNQFLEQLVTLKLARWSAISTIPFYFDPKNNWFIKPNTTKMILNYFEMDKELVYKPRPSYAFYRDYSTFLDEMKDQCDPKLSINNAAFTGFLMMTIN
ncbi:hypothetical protein [Leucothrix pacifica]|uniref:Uncharacterized protein n=1 Tax=Leucothrix pacifica TaxID=1247513 RepID=A0A317C8M7_9GAMM|nr:hypothetical protein [Leucothrix pacifica]PWQ92670.1 hypothetical protein DKW60_19715 [Leucothrix pacifica]